MRRHPYALMLLLFGVLWACFHGIALWLHGSAYSLYPYLW